MFRKLREGWKDLWNLLSGRDQRQFERYLAEGSADRDARHAVQMTARGNIAITEGRFVTTEDLERERAEMLDFGEEGEDTLARMIREDREHRQRYGVDQG